MEDEEAAAERHEWPMVKDGLRRLQSLLEARQRQLRARIAACDELRAEMAVLQATLRAECRPPHGSSCPGSGEVGPAPTPLCSRTHQAPGPAGGSSEAGGRRDAKP